MPFAVRWAAHRERVRMNQPLQVTSPAFEPGGLIPIEYTGYGEDRSPALQLAGLPVGAVSLAVVMDDLGHPIPEYNHWVIWNLPVAEEIPEAIPAGGQVTVVAGSAPATQGRGYGRQRYAGPKPPFNWSHEYRYRVYALNCRLELPPTTRKRQLLAAMQGHQLAHGEIIGHYR